MKPFIFVDAHQDLAYNALNFQRDYLKSAEETRLLEKNTPVPKRAGDTVLGWPDFQRGQTALIFSTIFAAPKRYQAGEWDKLVFSDPAEAYRIYHAQVEFYERWCGDHPDLFRLVKTRRDLRETWQPWEQTPADPPAVKNPVGLVLLMEGGEGIRDANQLVEWWEAGIRILGPVWAGTRFCGGMFEPGGFTREGYELLDGMAELGFTLDISHMNEQSSLQALERYPGPIIASHSNARMLLKDATAERHITDLTIQKLVEREGVIGTVFFNKYLQANWAQPDPRIPLEVVATHIDYICQMAGNSLHAGIGTDIDGGFGMDSLPAGIDSIADIQKIPPILAARGYQEEDIANIMGMNWKRHLERNLPI